MTGSIVLFKEYLWLQYGEWVLGVIQVAVGKMKGQMRNLEAEMAVLD